MITPCSPVFAVLEKALYLLVDSADGLNVAELVHRSGYSESLLQGGPGKGGKKAVQLRGRGAVSLDASVHLFEGDAGRKGEGHVLGIFPSQGACQDKQSLVVDRSCKLHLPLDDDNAFLPHVDVRGKP